MALILDLPQCNANMGQIYADPRHLKEPGYLQPSDYLVKYGISTQSLCQFVV